MKLMQERLESLKAGIIGSFAVAFSFLLTTVINELLLNQYFDILNINQFQLINLVINLEFLLSAGIAGFSGFLFGVTYRYIIRADKNSHLKSGAVFAFGLVRGLSQIELGWNINNSILPFVILAAESIFWFALARIILDFAIFQGLLKPFLSTEN
ncbi:hypothetical protein WJM97_12840 [Okeanomitos corallinicola TIOX110]|uniref:Uncharacterized protein n=1 Tax=Okeanomitos corallinicola TIOX110 TaxID=3133117 RepID=A0ABZ2UMC8_9CYAN